MDKKSKGNALDGLLGKLDKQLNAENSNRKAKPQALGIGIAGAIAGVTASPFGTPSLRQPNARTTESDTCLTRRTGCVPITTRA